jgi:hypothetical protein
MVNKKETHAEKVSKQPHESSGADIGRIIATAVDGYYTDPALKKKVDSQAAKLTDTIVRGWRK